MFGSGDILTQVLTLLSPMPTQIKDSIPVADLNAVREFLLNGRELPSTLERPRQPSRKPVASVPCHRGIIRARERSVSKN